MRIALFVVALAGTAASARTVAGIAPAIPSTDHGGATAAASGAIAPPAITPGQTATAAGGATLTLAGTDFGTKKGKVAVGGAKAKVVTWTDTAVTFVVPATIPNGAVVVDVTNALGTGSISGYLTITGSSVPLAKNKVIGALGGKRFRPRIHYIFYTGNDWSLQMITKPKHGKTLTFHIFGLTTVPAIYHGAEDPPATLTFDDGKGTVYTGKPGDFTITITHHEQNKFGGVISGVVTAPSGATIPIESVQFIYDTGL